MCIIIVCLWKKNYARPIIPSDIWDVRFYRSIQRCSVECLYLARVTLSQNYQPTTKFGSHCVAIDPNAAYPYQIRFPSQMHCRWRCEDESCLMTTQLTEKDFSCVGGKMTECWFSVPILNSQPCTTVNIWSATALSKWHRIQRTKFTPYMDLFRARVYHWSGLFCQTRQQTRIKSYLALFDRRWRLRSEA